MSKESKQRAALQKIREVFGIDIELPLESQEDKMREAQSVLIYFDTKGRDFKKKECKNCKRVFAYIYHTTGIQCCSVVCMAAELEKIGLKWDPSRELERRWGCSVPVIVPPDALDILQELVGTPDDSSDNTDP